jgi:hypothetical protein
MAAGFPVKQNYATGDVLTAANMNDLSETLNYLDPTAKGDLFPASSATALTRLAVGANDTVLTADSSTATGLKWATSSSGGMTLLSTTSLSGATTTISSINQEYNTLYAVIFGVTNATADGELRCKPNNENFTQAFGAATNTTVRTTDADAIRFNDNQNMTRTNAENSFTLEISNYASTTSRKPILVRGGYTVSAGQRGSLYGGQFNSTTAVTSLVFFNSGGNLSTGTVLLYGVK